MYNNCYRCGQPGHYSAECPARERDTHPPQPPSGAADPPPAAIYRRPPAEISQHYADHARSVREVMGWASSAEEKEKRSRAKAAEQVAESRANRLFTPVDNPVDNPVDITPDIT